MAIITVTPENLDQEHICCAIGEKKGEPGVPAKKAWLRERMAEGLVFNKLDERGKVFIEYIPAEFAWYPIHAPNCLHINCLWVSGKYAGHGYGNALLDGCIADAKAMGKDGITILSSSKKMPFLSDPKYLAHRGFQVADTAQPHFTLLYLPLNPNAPLPKFNDTAKTGTTEEPGLVLYYTSQCPHTAKHAPFAAEVAQSHDKQLKLVHIQSAQQAQAAPCPFTTYSLFQDGTFVTNEILSEKKLNALFA